MTVDRLMRLPSVQEAQGKKRTRIYQDVDEGLLTRPVRISANAVRLSPGPE